MLDAFLGIKKSVKISSFQDIGIRFGIETIEHEEPEGTEGILEILNIEPQETGHITISDKKNSVQLQSALYLLPDNIQAADKLARIELKLFDLFIKKEGIDFVPTIENNKPYHIDEIIKYYKTLEILHQSNKSVSIKTTFQGIHLPSSITTRETNEEFKNPLPELIFIKKMASECEHYDPINLSIDDLIASGPTIQAINSISNNEAKEITLLIPKNIETRENLDNSILLNNIKIRIDNTEIIAVISVKPKKHEITETKKETIKIVSKETKIEKIGFFRLDDPQKFDIIDNVQTEIEEENLEKEVNIITFK